MAVSSMAMRAEALDGDLLLALDEAVHHRLEPRLLALVPLQREHVSAHSFAAAIIHRDYGVSA